VTEEKPRVPFTYNIVEFVTREVDIDTNLIPAYADEDAARAAGHIEGDIFKTPDGRLGMVGVIPRDGRE
jgi:hypothetical protein